MSNNNNTNAALVNPDLIYSANYTYEFLTGINTTGTHRPKQIRIPVSALNNMTGMERQYWEIKMKYFDVVLFFKKGKFYELYDCDAVIGNKEFGLKMTSDSSNRGKMRMSGVPEQSFAEWSRLFVFKGYKVGKVEQMVVDAAMIAANGGKDPKCIPRELAVILTRGTLTENNAISGPEPIYVVGIYPVPKKNTNNNNNNQNTNSDSADSIVENLYTFDAIAVDISRQAYYHCPCDNVTELVTLMHHLTPKELLLPATLQNENNNAATDSLVLTTLEHAIVDLLPECHIEKLGGDVLPSSNASQNNFPSSWFLLFKYFEYLKVDADRLLPRKFYYDRQQEQQQQKLAQVKREKGVENDNDNDDEQITEEHIFVHYTKHQKQQVVGSDAAGAANAGGRIVLPSQTKTEKILAVERRYDPGMLLDSAAIECLDLVVNSRDGTSHATVLSWLLAERASLPVASRMIRAWLLRPSSNELVIEARQSTVQLLYQTPAELNQLVARWKSLLEKPKLTASNAAAAPRQQEQQDDEDEDDDDDENNNINRSSSGGRKSGGSGISLPQNISVATIDFERLLSRISDFKSEDTRVALVEPLVNYKKHLISIHTLLQGFESLLQFQHVADGNLTQFEQKCDANKHKGKLLRELVDNIGQARTPINEVLKLFPRQRIERDGFLLPLKGENESYDKAEQELSNCVKTINEKLMDFRRKLQDNSLSFCDLGKDLFLLEVPTKVATNLKKLGIPDGELTERARTSAKVKLSVSSLQKTINEYKKASTARELAILATLRQVASVICASWHLLFSASRAAGYLDCLFALSSVASQQAARSDICFPVFQQALSNKRRDAQQDFQQTSIDLVDAYHPLLLLLGRKCVPNSISLGGYDEKDDDDTISRSLVCTGPNAAGKSTLMRTVAVNIILAQLGCPVCAKAMTIFGAPIDRIFTRIGAKDATHRGQSTLFVELSETATILKEATGRSLCLLDELGRGTSTHDGYAIAHACLRTLAGISTDLEATYTTLPSTSSEQQQNNNTNNTTISNVVTNLPLVLFATHYHALALEISLLNGKARQRVLLGYMDFTCGSRRQRGSEHQDGEGGSSSQEIFASPNESNNNNNNSQTSTSTTGEGSSSEVSTDVEFLYKLVPGICARSYGAEVALQAGLPRDLVERARRVSRQMAVASADHQLADFKKFMRVTMEDIVKRKQNGEEFNEAEMLAKVRSRAAQLVALANAAVAAS